MPRTFRGNHRESPTIAGGAPILCAQPLIAHRTAKETKRTAEGIPAETAVAFYEALQPEFVQYQMQVVANAAAMAQAFVKKGYQLVSGGTDNHLMLIDLRGKFQNVCGKLAEKELGRADITLNKNMVPFDNRSPFLTSGLRVGTPAITSRGFKEEDVVKMVDLIDEVLCSCAKWYDPQQSPAASIEAIGEFALFDDFATGCREFCDVAGVSGYGGESVGVEFEAVVAVVGGVDFLEVELVGVDDLLCLLDDGVGHGVERVFGL